MNPGEHPIAPAKEDRELAHIGRSVEAVEREGRFGPVSIEAAKEFQRVFSATSKSGPAQAGLSTLVNLNQATTARM